MNDHDRRTLRVALLAAAALVAWALFVTLVLPVFIRHAHQGTLPAVFSDLLPRRGHLPLEHYLARVQRTGAVVFALAALGALALVAATRPGVQQFLTRRFPAASAAPPTGRRGLLVTAVIVVVVGGHLFEIVTGTEHWPFSHYGMFSGLAPRDVSSRLSLYGVTDSGDVSLNVPAYFAPLDDQRIRGSIKKLRRRPDAEAAVEYVLRDAGARYERLRLSGVHHGPRILAIKLVETSWTQHHQIENRDQPDAIRVLHEVRLVEGGAPTR